MEAGLDGTLLGAGCVAVGQHLEGSLAVLMVEVISSECFSQLLWRAVCGGGALP